MNNSNQQRLIFALLLPTIIMVVTALFLYLISVFIIPIRSSYWGLPIAASMLIGNFILIYILGLSYEELGLKYTKETLLMHIFGFTLLLAYSIATIYLIGFSIFSKLGNLMIYEILFFTIAAFADEIYFRGIIYGLLQVWDEKTAFLGSSLIYGFWTIPVGYTEIFVALLINPSVPLPLGPMERILFALSLGAIRYSSKMIYLAIPAHIIINLHNYLFVAGNASAEIITISYFILLVVIGILIYASEFIKKRSAQKTNGIKAI